MPTVLGTDTWNADVLGAAASAFRVSARVVSQRVGNHMNLLRMAGGLWSLDTQLKNILEGFYTEVSKVSQTPVVPPTEERLRSAILSLRTLCGKIDELYNMAKAAGLTNRTLIGTALNSIRVRGDELLDIAESAELSLEAEVTEPIFAKALGELERGETFDLASIR